jgi:hypothetical protein
MMLAAILALALAAAVPAIAQVGLEAGGEAESDDVALDFSVENTGNYASQCTPAVQFGNTGNFNNTPVFQQYASGFQQYGGGAGDFEPEGIEFVIEPSIEAACDSTIQQSSAASSYTYPDPASSYPVYDSYGYPVY